MTELDNRIALVTGAGGGFGRHLTRQLRAAGARLVLTDVGTGPLQGAVDDAGDALVCSVAADLSTEAGCDHLVAACRGAGVAPDLLVNNAGVGLGGRPDHVPRDHWERLVQLNLLAPMRLTAAFLPGMLERGRGHVANVCSLAGWVGSQGLSAYCASKFGLRGFGEALAADLDGTGVRVTNIYPCFSRTAILDSPQYGYEERRIVPEWLISEPGDVVRHMIDGIRKDRLHVFPDRHARRIHYLVRFAPWVIPLLNRRMEADAIKAGRETV